MGKRANYMFNIYSTLYLMSLELNNKQLSTFFVLTTRKILDKIQSLTTRKILLHNRKKNFQNFVKL